MSKTLIRLLGKNEHTVNADALPSKCSIASGEYTFHYVVESGVAFICLCDRSYPRLLAFSYLSEIQRGFFDDFGGQKGNNSGIQGVVRPYAFIKYEPFIQATKKRYLNTRQLRTQEDLVDLSSRIQSINVLQAYEVFGSQDMSGSSGGLSLNGSSMNTLNELTSNITNAIAGSISAASKSAPGSLLPGGSLSGVNGPRSWITKAAIGLSLLIVAVDVRYGVWWTVLGGGGVKYSGDEPIQVITGFAKFYATILALMSPILIIQ
ncbi:SNAP receptor, partial [Quaeritorhiza haematococci]